MSAFESHRSLEVVIPTRNRPEKLGRCLAALNHARDEISFPVLVCDSSDDKHHAAVLGLSAQYPFVRVTRHNGRNVAAARNACSRAAIGDILVNVDDDICVESGAIIELITHYARSSKPCVIAGAVAWNGSYSFPVVMRYIGYGRAAKDGEQPSFLVGAFFAYARELALALRWNERIRTSDDRFMGALWRSHDIGLGYCSSARATHDAEQVTYSVDEQTSHIYVNMFDAVIANPSVSRALSYELLGFMAGARAYCRSPVEARRYCAAWLRGHRHLVRDYAWLREMVHRRLPDMLREE